MVSMVSVQPSATSSVSSEQIGALFITRLRSNLRVYHREDELADQYHPEILVQIGLILEDAYEKWTRSDFDDVPLSDDGLENLIELFYLPSLITELFEIRVAFAGAALMIVGDLANWVTDPTENPWQAGYNIPSL